MGLWRHEKGGGGEWADYLWGRCKVVHDDVIQYRNVNAAGGHIRYNEHVGLAVTELGKLDLTDCGLDNRCWLVRLSAISKLSDVAGFAVFLYIEWLAYLHGRGRHRCKPRRCGGSPAAPSCTPRGAWSPQTRPLIGQTQSTEGAKGNEERTRAGEPTGKRKC